MAVQTCVVRQTQSSADGPIVGPLTGTHSNASVVRRQGQRHIQRIHGDRKRVAQSSPGEMIAQNISTAESASMKDSK